MTSDDVTKAINHLEAALAVTREALAECHDRDDTLKMNEVAIECVLKDYRKRLKNCIELELRDFAA